MALTILPNLHHVLRLYPDEGMLTFLDPPKESAGKAITALRDNGVAVKVLTGDNPVVTARICLEVGIDAHGILTGTQIEAMTDRELEREVEMCSVFAKLTPLQKSRILKTLQKNGHTVGFLGDGINDAPALRDADVGISVDSVADIAKEASDIILLEKDLMVLEEGVIKGRITGMDNQILSLYAKGMTTREIAAAFKELYDADVSPALVSKVTDAVMEQVTEWQNRPLEAVYPIVYLDCIVLKVRQDSRVINKSVFLALGINIEGQKELLGMWLAENEGAKFWLNVLTELKNRGLNDILIARVDGLKGFPDAINAVYPEARIQLCIVHMVRNSLRFVSWKDYKAVTRDLKAIYQAPTEEAGLQALEAFAAAWDSRYPQISRSWE